MNFFTWLLGQCKWDSRYKDYFIEYVEHVEGRLPPERAIKEYSCGCKWGESVHGGWNQAYTCGYHQKHPPIV